MNKRLSGIIVVLMAAFLLGGCAAAVQPVRGMLFSDVKGPVGVTANTSYSKVGTSMAQSYLGLIGIGDASIDAACKKANIKRVHHVDYHTKNILGLYAEFTVTVYGD